MKLQQLYSRVRRALDDYNMIADGDKIAIGISGGKDSLTLLYALAGLRKFYPKKYDLVAISVDLGIAEINMSDVQKLCEKLEVPLTLISTQIGPIIFEERKESSPCSLCAKMRKGALNEAAIHLGCNKVAYAHHMDDIIETMFLSMIYEGKFYTFPPVTKLDKTNLTVIRPLMYVLEADVIGFKNKYELPVVNNPCPFDHTSERSYVRQLLNEINRHAPGVKQRMMTAICDGTIPEWKK